MKLSELNRTVENVVQVGATIVTVYLIVRTSIRPDQLRYLHMRGLREAENYCQRNATTWAHLADACKVAYDKTRLSV